MNITFNKTSIDSAEISGDGANVAFEKCEIGFCTNNANDLDDLEDIADELECRVADIKCMAEDVESILDDIESKITECNNEIK